MFRSVIAYVIAALSFVPIVPGRATFTLSQHRQLHTCHTSWIDVRHTELMSRFFLSALIHLRSQWAIISRSSRFAVSSWISLK